MGMKITATAAAAIAGTAVFVTTLHGSPQDAETVRVRLESAPRRAVVVQAIEPAEDPRWFLAMRGDGQSLELIRVTANGESIPVDDIHLESSSSTVALEIPASESYHITYAVTGELDRIPLFVAAGGAELTVVSDADIVSGRSRVIRVEGDGDLISDLDIAYSMPRFAPGEDGSISAEVSSIPALIRLSPRAVLSPMRLADLAVLGLIVLVAVWVWRGVRRTAV